MSIAGVADVPAASLVLAASWRLLRASLHIRIATAPSTTTNRPINIAAMYAKAVVHPSPCVPGLPLLLTMPPSFPARQPGWETLLGFHHRLSGHGSDTGMFHDDCGFSTLMEAAGEHRDRSDPSPKRGGHLSGRTARRILLRLG